MKSVAAFLVVALIWFCGLLAFASRVQHQTPARAPVPAQGIVALTGAGSNERLGAAVGLLEDGYGSRVLVSGVNRMASREDIRRAAGVVRASGAAIFTLIALAAAAVVAFATRAGLAARRDVVEVLHLTGAEDGQIANLFEVRFARVAALSGAIGAVAAMLVGAVLRLIGGGAGITPALPIAWLDLLAVLPCPVIAAIVAAVAARLTARRLIQDL